MVTAVTKRQIRKIAPSLLLIGLVYLFGLYVYGPSLAGRLVLIDDHEFFLLLGPTKEFPIAEIFSRLVNLTELGRWGESMRFRPFYFFERALETSVWGLDPFPRFALRLVIASSLAATLSYFTWSGLANKFSNRIHLIFAFATSFLVGVITLSLSSWSDIILRLGPSEIFIALALIPLFIGIRRIWASPSSWPGWTLIFLGYTIMILSKENSFSLLAIIFILVFINWNSLQTKLPVILGFAFTISITLWVELGIFIAMSLNGGDVYGNQRSLSAFVSKLIQEPYIYLSILGLAATLYIEIANLEKQLFINSLRNKTIIEIAKSFQFSLMILASIWVILIETFVYQSANEKRYLLLSQVALVIVLLAVLFALTRIKIITAKGLILLVTGLAIIAYGLEVSRSSLGWKPTSIQEQSRQATLNSHETNQHIQELIKATQQFPEAPVVLFLDTPLLEHSFAISRITWFATGNYLYFANPYPELQTGSKGLLFRQETYEPVPGVEPICVTFAKVNDLEQYSCSAKIHF